MRLSAVVTLVLLSISSTFAQSITLEVAPDSDIKDSIKAAVVKLVKGEATLAQEYSKSMDQAFSFLDPEDPRRINASDIANFDEYALSTWIPSHSFRFGQGDYTYCDMETETASFDMGTVLVGFDTSYKREETYGFWAIYSYYYDWCESDSEEPVATKARIRLEHNKWLSEEVVSELLYQ